VSNNYAYIPSSNNRPVAGQSRPSKSELEAPVDGVVSRANLPPPLQTESIVLSTMDQGEPDAVEAGSDHPVARTAENSGAFDADDAALQASDSEAPALPEPVVIVSNFLAGHNIQVKFDGSFVVGSGLQEARSQADVPEALRRSELTLPRIVDQLVLASKAAGYKAKKSDLTSALREIIHERQQERYAYVLADFIKGDDAADGAAAEPEWSRLALVFDIDPALATAILKHFVWQVKRKVLNKTVTHHLMPIIYSALQGTGKSTFAKRFLEPLQELASDPVTMSDFADPRSGDIFRYPVVLIDDIDTVTERQTAVLKSVMTSTKIRRRRLGTSMSVAYRQNSTLFGTANKDVSILVADDTGHRRFAMLPFRNGSVEKGGDAEIWRIINEIDYLSLWRSVDPFKDTPIKVVLEALAEHQGVAKDPLNQWFDGLDLNSEAVRRVLVQAGIQARDLYDLFCEQTDIEMSEVQFGKRMRRLIKTPNSPFVRKARKASGYYYEPRKQ